MNCPRCDAPMAVVERRGPLTHAPKWRGDFGGNEESIEVVKYHECVRCRHVQNVQREGGDPVV